MFHIMSVGKVYSHMCMVYVLVLAPRFFIHWLLGEEVYCGRSESDIFHGINKHVTIKKKHARRRSCSNFHLPLKNVIFTVGVKSVSKMSFLRSMGSTKNDASYGAWETHFRVLQHLRSEKATFFSAFIPQRGAKNWKLHSYGAWEAKKNMLHTEHGKHNFDFCNPSRVF